MVILQNVIINNGNFIFTVSFSIMAFASKLKPDFGVNYREIGNLQPSSDYFYITINFDLPLRQSEKVLNSTIDKLDCPLDMEIFTNVICTDFIPVFENFKKRAHHLKFKLEKNIKSIGTLTHTKENINRHKRFPIIMTLSGFFTAGFKVIQ